MSNGNRQTLGYLAGIGAGVSYGLNPLFFKGLSTQGVTVHSILFFRYVIALGLMLMLIAFRRERISVTRKQTAFLLMMGVLFALSSEGLFQAYNYIPAGLATTIVYLYPVFSALILVGLGQRPSWQSWVAIAGTLAGVVMICWPTQQISFRVAGIIFSAFSALVYATYLVMVNNSKTVSNVPPDIITLFALVSGCIMFFLLNLHDAGHNIMDNVYGAGVWFNLFCLGLFPTLVSMLCLAVSTRYVGPAKTGILGVFEPITAIVIGIAVYNERLTPLVFSGILIAIISVMFLVLTKHRQ